MSRRWLLGALVATLGLMSMTRSARATGACENTEAAYEPPHAWADASQSFATWVTQPWCEEDDRSGVIEERRGSLRFVELRDVRGQVLGRLAAVRGPDAQRLKDAAGPFEYVPAARDIARVLKERGYTRLGATSTGPVGRCSFQAAWQRTRERQNGFPGGRVSVDLMAGGKRIVRLDVGPAAAQRRAAVAVRAQFVAERRAVAVWVRLPQCSGPPPGYFEAGAPGTCYEQDVPVVLYKDVSSLPELAGCFEGATTQ